MVNLIAKNLITGHVIELTTDWFFDDRYCYFILEHKENWVISVKE